MNRGTELVPIEAIVVGERLRQDNGDIAGLAESIRAWGLIHPLTISADNELIAGGRRLLALKRLGYTEAEVRRWDNLTDAERRELELEENLQRKDLTAYERTRTLVDLVETVHEVDQESFARIPRETREGRPPESGSTRRVSERIGIPDTTIRDAQKHVEVAETFPVFQKPAWKQYQALEAAEVLNSLPEAERPAAVQLIDQPSVLHPKDAIRVLRNVAGKPDDERHRVLTLATSDDDRDKMLALTVAAEVPPMPDPRISLLEVEVIRRLKTAISVAPSDPEAPRLRAVIDEVRSIIASIREGDDRRVATVA